MATRHVREEKAKSGGSERAMSGNFRKKKKEDKIVVCKVRGLVDARWMEGLVLRFVIDALVGFFRECGIL